jgi:hypothetical protein
MAHVHDHVLDTFCGAKVCQVCDDHLGLARCYCGWSRSGGDGLRELVEMGEVSPMTTETAKALDDYCLEEQLAAALRAGDRPEVELLRDEARRRFAGMMGLPTSLMADLAPCWRRPLAILEPARGPIRLLRTPGRRRRLIPLPHAPATRSEQ